MGLDICGDDSIYLPPSGSCDECAEFAQRLEVVEDALPDKQDKLTAGTNITIDANNVISATGGGGGGDSYWQENSDYLTPVSGYDGVVIGGAGLQTVIGEGAINVDDSTGSLNITGGGIRGLPSTPAGDTYATSKKYVDDQIADVTLTATTPIVKTGTVLSHADSGVTAGSKGDTTNQTPAFGGTFKALSETVNAKGHVTALAEHTVKIPDTKASTTADGLMSKEDKATIDGLDTTYQKKLVPGTGIAIDTTTNTISATGVSVTVASPITLTGSTIGHADSGATAGSKGDTTAQTPAFGGTFKAVSATVNATGHITALNDHNVTIPNTKASSTADGLMSKEDKATLDAIPTTYQPKLTAGTNVQITGNTISATDTTYTAGTNVQISGSNVISATDTTYTAGDNITITGTTISADEYTGSDYIDIDANKVVSITNMDDLIVQKRYTTASQTMAAGAEREIAFPVEVPAGYKTLGVAAVVVGAYSCSAARITESTMRVKNYGTSSVTFTPVLRVNYIKEDFTTIAS